MFKRRRLNRIRQACREKLEDLGYSDDQINSVIEQVTDQKVSETTASLPPEVVQKYGALGDGTIFNAILDFFKSPEGQALISALVKMLIAMLTGL